MASLGLQQCHSPAPSLPGAGRIGTPLPLQLIRHALASVNSSFPAEHCLLPLAVYNQTATLCKERLCCEQMSDAAAAAADAAFEELLNLLSGAVRQPFSAQFKIAIIITTKSVLNIPI